MTETTSNKLSGYNGVQLVWWGGFRFWLIVPGEDDPLNKIYRWRVRIGPLEVRRWV